MMKTSKNWVVWCRSRKKGNEELEQFLSEDGREVFQGTRIDVWGGKRRETMSQKRRR